MRIILVFMYKISLAVFNRMLYIVTIQSHDAEAVLRMWLYTKT